MKRIIWPAVLALRLLATSDLSQIEADPNLEHRAQRALNEAFDAFTHAKTDYAAGNREQTARDLTEMQNAVELAQNSLRRTGRNPRKHSKPFKLAELQTRDLLRKLDGFEQSMDFEDRKMVEAPKARVQEAHDQWVNGIISGER